VAAVLPLAGPLLNPRLLQALEDSGEEEEEPARPLPEHSSTPGDKNVFYRS